MSKYLDLPSVIVAALTLVLFLAALFVKGVTHDLFLEAGVFLISVKVLIMIHRHQRSVLRLESKIDALLERQARGRQFAAGAGAAPPAAPDAGGQKAARQ